MRRVFIARTVSAIAVKPTHGREPRRAALEGRHLKCGQRLYFSPHSGADAVFSHTEQSSSSPRCAEPGYVIRPASKDDAKAFANVVAAAQETWVSWAGVEFQPYDAEQLSEQWSQRLDDLTTTSFVCTDANGLVIAVAAAGPEARSFEPSSTRPDSAHLSTLFALPDYHGSGAAQELHDHLLSSLAAESYGTVRLWVPREASRARRFYTRNGWVETGTETNFAGLLRTELRRSI